MTEMMDKETYTFLMPGEERLFFDYFHVIAIVLFLLLLLVGVFSGETSAGDVLLNALIVVVPLYVIRFLFAKCFADRVTLDFQTEKIHFFFHDERGEVIRDFSEVTKVNFQYYLVFVLKDAKIMVKRPGNKKEAFQILDRVFTVFRGYFAMP